MRCRLAVIPKKKKPRVPHCQERPESAHSRTKSALRIGGDPRENRGSHTARSGPGAAYSRRDQVSCSLAMSPGKPRVPHCEERQRNRTLQEGPCACCGLVASL